MADYHERIVRDPAVRSGQPIVSGTRITVADILGCLAAGMAIGEILADFPDLCAEDIRAALAFAADHERHRFGPHDTRPFNETLSFA